MYQTGIKCPTCDRWGQKKSMIRGVCFRCNEEFKAIAKKIVEDEFKPVIHPKRKVKK